MKKIKKLLITWGIIGLLILFSTTIGATNFLDFGIDRMQYVNKNYCQTSGKLNVNDAITYEQAENRVRGIIYWSKLFNYMYPSIHHKRVAKDILAIAEHETAYVNWDSVLDNGDSFGMFSMQWDTLEYIVEKNKWEINKTKIQSDPFYQAKFAVWYYYRQLQVKKDRFAAIMAYNYPAIKSDNQRWRKYFMNVLGVIQYHHKLMQKK